MKRYTNRSEFEYIEPLSYYEGEPFIIRGQGEMKEKMRDDEPDSSKQKSPREAGYEVDDEDSDAKSYPNLKKLKRYIMVSEEEDKSGEQEDDKDRDPDYNPFFDEDTLF